ncbi:MAG: PHP domain-containing protein [Clostridia bacterium]
MYNIIADLHTHTIASTHAYSTVAEMVTSAKNKGLYAIAITDHGKTMYGSPAEYYFDAMKFLPLMQDGVKVISGQETNIIDFSGTIDYNPNDEVNFVIASVHNIPIETLRNPSVEKCTYMYLNVAQNKHVNTIGHSGSELFKYDYEKVIPELRKIIF